MNKSLAKYILLVIPIFLTSCASQPDAPKPAASSQSTTTSDVELLSEFKEIELETSNGALVIEPTVVATTDDVQSDDETSNVVEYYDPLESINRSIFTFNHFAYKYALIPIAKGYDAVLPDPVQTSIGNVFSNVSEPLNLVNNVLSGEFKQAGSNVGRFLINSTIGLLGIFDPASSWFDIKEEPQAFSQTLSKYGVGSGAYLVIPILGQSDVRGTTSIVSESLIHPTKYIFESPDDLTARIVDGFHDFSSQVEIYETLYENSQDPYVYFRNQYIQSRNRNDIALEEQKEVNIAPIYDAANESVRESVRE